MRVQIIPCLSDNYAYLLVCEETNDAVIVDASEPGPVLSALGGAGVRLTGIWSTHHHHDHVGGNDAVRAEHGVDVYGHASDRGRLPGQTRFLESGDSFDLGRIQVKVQHIPGHTMGAIAYVVKDPSGSSAVFTGDTLFVAGCGRLFEGTPRHMHASLSWLASLDPETLVYCGHEYTESNLRFAEAVEPGNVEVTAAIQRARATRAEGRPTVPSTIAQEKRTNPFLRPGSAEIRRTLGVPPEADYADAFAAIRAAKDSFR
jgi:hydroxyacylglutathione hydrolase